MKKLVAILIFILFLNLAIASFDTGNPSSDIETQYARGSSLRGWINISLENEQVNSLLTSNIQGSISLLDFLQENDADFSCNPSDCKSNYIGTESAESKEASLSIGGEKTYVLKLSGEIESVDSLSFSLSSNAQSSCINPIEIKLADESVWKFNSSSNDFSCFESKGCYQDSIASLDKELTSTPYCEKITLQDSSKFELGAYVKKGTTSSVELKMQLYNLDEEKKAECVLQNIPNEGLANCKVNVTASGNYYVCIIANKRTDWKIKSETQSPCGSFGFPIEDNLDVYVYAKSAKFSEFLGATLTDRSIKNDYYGSFSELISDYLDKYDDCKNDCYIPLKIISGANQQLTISNIQLSYTSSTGAKTSNFLYNASETQATIDMDYEKLDLQYANMSVTGAYGDKELNLYLRGQIIDSEIIEITEIADIQELTPRTAAAGVSTDFTIKLSNSSNIKSYEWDFDDGETEDTTKNKISHLYTETGAYNLEVKIIDKNDNENIKIFSISVVSPESLISEVIKDKKADIKNIKNKTSVLPDWIKEKIDDFLDIEQLNRTLTTIEEEYQDAEDEDEFIDVMIKLNNLSIPSDFLATDTSSGIFVPEEDKIDLEFLKQAGAGAYDPEYEEQYQEAIVSWFITNIDSSFSSKTYSFIYPDENQDILTAFSLTLNPNEKVYLIFENNPVFKQNYEEEKSSSFSSIEIDEQTTIEFLYTGKVALANVFYASPDFDKLNVQDIEPLNPKFPFGWILFFLIILFILAFLVYLFLQQWYKRNYENSLFLNRNDLFNLINFIKNAFSKAMSEKEIIKKLKETGWKREQVVYALNKAKGKRTGMFEIPILSLFNRKKANARLQENLNNLDSNKYWEKRTW